MAEMRRRKKPPEFSRLMKAAADGSLLPPTDEEELFAVDYRGRTALDWAKRRKQLKHAAILKSAMLDIETKRKEDKAREARTIQQKTVLERNAQFRIILKQAIREGDAAAAKRALKAADIEREDFDQALNELEENDDFYVDVETETGGNALGLAASAADEALAEDLVFHYKVKIDRENQRGHTAATWACVCGAHTVLAFLLRSGAKVNRESIKDKRTPLIHAAERGQAQCLELILDRLHLDSMTHDDFLLERSLSTPDPITGLTPLALALASKVNTAYQVLKSSEKQVALRQAQRAESEMRRQSVQCPRDRCTLYIPREQLPIHLLNHCAYRPTGCDLCGMRIPLADLESHRRSTCPSRHLQCHKCGQELPASALTLHMQSKCPKRLVVCRFGCGLSQQIEAQDRADHELYHCTHRAVPCPLCSYEMPANQLGNHALLHCPRRLVECSVGCGRKDICFENIYHHENFECMQYCKWNCGTKIGPTPRRIAHERVECPRRGVECPNDCGANDIAAEAMGIHLSWTCPRRQISCVCGWTGHFGESHQCDEKQLRCRYELLGRRIEYRNSSSTKRGVLRRYDEKLDLYLIGGTAQWININTLDGIVLIDNDNWKCGWVAAADMPNHLAQCAGAPPNTRATTVEEDNSALNTTEKTISKSKEEDDAKYKVLIRCKYGCGTAFKTLELADQHSTSHCSKRPVTCVCNRDDIWAEELEAHQSECPVLNPKPAPKGKLCACGEYVTDMAAHSEVCVARACYCPNGCGHKEALLTIHEHVAVCPRRFLQHGVLMDCVLGCGRQGLRYQDKWAHEATECPRRLTECKLGCGQVMTQSQLEEHHHICGKRMLPCGAGAGGCQRQLQSWFFESVENERRLLVPCDVHGATLLHLAVLSRDTILLKYLLEEIDLDQELGREGNDGHTALTRACVMDWTECVDILVRAGADLNLETMRGRTPLIEAAKAGAVETARYLVDQGAHIAHRSRHRTTALDWAQRSGHIELHRQLRRDLEVHLDTVRLFNLVSLDDYDAVGKCLSVGEPYRRGQIQRVCDDIVKEDKALEVAIEDADRLRNVLKMAESDAKFAQNELIAANEASNATESAADDALAAKDRLENIVSSRARLANLALESTEPADIQEIRALRHDIVPSTTIRVLSAVCEMLHAEKHKEPLFSATDELIDDQASESTSNTRRENVKESKSSSAKRWNVMKKMLNSGLPRRLRFFSINSALSNDAKLVQRIHQQYGDNPSLFQDLNDDDATSIAELTDEDEVTVRTSLQTASEAATLAGNVTPVIQPEEDDNGIHVDGYELIGALAVWLNGQAAAFEARSALAKLEAIESTLRNRYQLERQPHVQKMQQAELLAKNRQKFRGQELERALKEKKECQHRVKVCEAKLRVARVLQKYAATGHSLLSWACALGNSRTAEVLLDRGACPSIPEQLEHSAIGIVQFIWRHHKWRKNEKAQDDRSTRVLKETAYQITIARQLNIHAELRKRIRVPLLEAAYNGQPEIFEVFKRCRALSTERGLVVGTARPQPPFPFALKPESSKTKLYTLMDCVQLGKKELGTYSHWQYGEGWVSGDASGAPREQSRIAAYAAWSSHARRVDQGRRKKESRALHRAHRQRRIDAAAALLAAINKGDFNRVNAIFDEENLIPVDYEDPDTGCTALIAAACEDTAAEHRIISRDVEQRPVFAVVLLLDRRTRRPQIDYENKRGETALIAACVRGRLDIAAALLERGADITRPSRNRCDWSPLRWAVDADRSEVVQYLLRHNAPLNTRAADKLSAIEAATQADRLDSLTVLHRYARHFADTATKLGVDGLVPCANGCGAFLTKADNHHDCPKKPVNCPECGDNSLWQEELGPHLARNCPIASIVTCAYKGCGATYRAEFSLEHSLSCAFRLEQCYMCGSDVRASRLSVHQEYFCPARKIRKKYKPRRAKREVCEHCLELAVPSEHDCPMLREVKCPNKNCGKHCAARDLSHHLASECLYRWTECLRCGLKVTVKDMESHLESERNDPNSKVPRCGLSLDNCQLCGAEMPLQQIEMHKKYDCPQRLVPCALCASEVVACDLNRHKAVDCPMRTAECPNECCTLRLPFSQLSKHATLECRKRIVRCQTGCGDSMRIGALKRHQSERCPFRFVHCSLCKKRMRFKDKERHLKKECVGTRGFL